MQNKPSIITKENELFGQVRFAYIDGELYAVGKDVATALGYADASGTVSKKCKGVSKMEIPTSGGNQITSLIPESDIYRLIFGSQLESAEKFKDWVFKEVLPQIRKTGSYTLAKEQYTVTPKEELECLDVVSGILNFNDNSKLLGVRSIYDKYGMETSYLPAYAPSKGILKSATELLKQFNVNMTTIKFNKKLVELGILKECTRQSTKDKNKTKKFKNLVDTTWGENQVNPKNSKETQPLYYEDKFMDLLKKLGI